MGRRLASIALAVVADSLRRRVVIVVLVFSFLLVLAIPSLPDYGLGVEGSVFREVSLSLSFVMALVVTLALAANRVPGEVERRTVYNIIAKRTSRWEYLVGTWAGIFLVVGGVIAVFTLVQQGVALFQYQDAMWRLWEGALSVCLEMGVVAAIAVAISARFGPVPVVALTLTALFVGHSAGMWVGGSSTLVGGEGALALAPFVPTLDAFNIVNPVAHGYGVPPIYLASMLAVFAGYTLLFLGLGSLVFSRKDL